MMHYMLVGLLLLGAEPGASTTPITGPPPAVREKLHAEFDREIGAALKRESRANHPRERTAAIRELCRIHQELVADPRYSTTDWLKGFRAKVWGRLMQTKAELKRQLARQNGPPGRGEVRETPEEIAREQAQSTAADSLATTLGLLDSSLGSPGLLAARGGGAETEANGRELVELIQHTINPDSWDVNGGPGTIFYYAPLQCLVVRASTEVHENLGGVVGALRK